jgi:siroheme synthase
MTGLRQLIKLVLCSNMDLDTKVAVIEQMSKREKRIINVKVIKDNRTELEITKNKKLAI